jgi:hypothetical protein
VRGLLTANKMRTWQSSVLGSVVSSFAACDPEEMMMRMMCVISLNLAWCPRK